MVITIFYAFVSVNLTAVQEAWFVGDEFLRSVYHYYPALQRKLRRQEKQNDGLFIFGYYNVSTYTMGESNGIRIAATRIQNSVVRLLNNCKSMPRFIFIIADNDIIKNNQTSINFFDWGARKACNEITKWLLDEVQDAVIKRKKAMRKILPGSVLPGELKIIYTKMCYRPQREKIQGLRNIFNNALENNMVGKRDHHIMKIETHNNHFDHTNCFTEQGAEAFWQNFDSVIKEFDQNNEKEFLKPVKQSNQNRVGKAKESEVERYKLPPPPPKHHMKKESKAKRHLNF